MGRLTYARSRRPPSDGIGCHAEPQGLALQLVRCPGEHLLQERPQGGAGPYVEFGFVVLHGAEFCLREPLNTTQLFCGVLMNQIAFPSRVTADEVMRERTLGGSIDLMVKCAGLTPKEIQDAIHADRAQYSRWVDEKEGILWKKLEAAMDKCGNDAPVLWMIHRRGYDLSSLRRQETELEQRLRLANEQIERMQAERQAERNLLSEVLAGRPVQQMQRAVA